MSQPENKIYDLLRHLNEDETAERMEKILMAGGEEAIKGLRHDNPVRKMYLKIRTRELDKEKKEHEAFMERLNKMKAKGKNG